MFRIAHLSDIHFGRIGHAGVVDALVDEVNAMAPDLVVVSGDLTQRARRRQFRAARALLDALAAPSLVVPGNHDVYAYWYPLGRLFQPLRRYRRFITGDLAPTFERDGLAVLGINSAYGWTIKGGRFGARERARIASFFAAQHDGAFKVLVVHHHLTKILALGRHDVARQARQALAAAVEAGVDLVLCGHLHVSHVEPLEVAPAQHRLVIASAGTATSDRGRSPHRETNFYNVVEVEPEAFTVEERRFAPAARCFESFRRTRFLRIRAAESLRSANDGRDAAQGPSG